MFARNAASAGSNPAESRGPRRPRRCRWRRRVRPKSGNVCRAPCPGPGASPGAEMSAAARPTPTPPPTTPSVSASPSTRTITRRLEKPSVLSTAISVRRSRTAMLIVLAVTSRIVKATARPMKFSRSVRLPASAMNPARNAFRFRSSSARRCSRRCASIDCAIAAAWFGLAIWMLKVPAPACLVRRLVEVLEVEEHHPDWFRPGACDSSSRVDRRGR